MTLRLWPLSGRAGVLAAVITGAMFAVYSTTLCPSVSFIDSGELAAVAVTLGIAHPTGYPLFTLVNRIAGMLPAAADTVLRLNGFAALLTALSVGVMFLLMMNMTQMLLTDGLATPRRTNRARWLFPLPAVVASLVFGLGSTVWSQSTAVEVYALHLFLITLFLLALLRGLAELASNPREVPPMLVFGSFLLGLSFANHMTTILLVPATLYIVLASLRRTVRFLPLALVLSPFFLLGLSIYLYLPVRSASGPPLDWGHPAELERLWWHVTGKQYRTWIFSSIESAERQFGAYASHFPAEFNLILLPVIALGLVVLFRRNRRLLWFLVILWGTCVAYAVNYDIYDIDSYFLLAHVATALMLVVGLASVWRWMQSSLVVPARVAGAALIVALPVVAWQSHHATTDQSDNWLVADYTNSALTSLDSNALVLSYQWDYLVSPSLYYQCVQHQRTDVTIVDKELLRRSWYLLQLERTAPWLISKSRAKVDSFREELSLFENGLEYHPGAIEWRYNEMINDFIMKSVETRPVYVGPEIEPQFGLGLVRLPEGLLFRLRRAEPMDHLRPFVLEIRPNRVGGRLADGLRLQCAKMLTFRGIWEIRAGNREEGSGMLRRSLEFVPGYAPAVRALESLGRGGGRESTGERR